MKVGLPMSVRLKFSRISFLVLGCRVPIIIGLMHLYVHFKSLLHPQIEAYLKNSNGMAQISEPLWETWGVVSFMMGWCSLVIGVLNSSIFMGCAKNQFPLVLPLAAMFGYYLGVFYVGWEYNQNFQWYGGLIGSALLAAALLFQWKTIWIFLGGLKK